MVEYNIYIYKYYNKHKEKNVIYELVGILISSTG